MLNKEIRTYYNDERYTTVGETNILSEFQIQCLGFAEMILEF